MEAVKIGIAGLGTVGGGTYAVLKRNAQELSRRAGAPIEVKTVVCRNIDRARGIVDERVTLSKDWHDLVNDPEIDIVVEVMGGIEPAKSLVLEAIAAGKHVVTANKALLALHGNEIFTAAVEKGVAVSYEAAVAGGIPIIKSLREGLAANRIEWIAGIINGTCNFILSTMRDKGLSFEEALAQAKALGYAEADPTFDIEGIDAAHKITLLSALAFGTPVNFDAVTVEGITKLTATDIRYAENMGYRIKLLGITKRTERGIELRVHPALVPMRRLVESLTIAQRLPQIEVAVDGEGHTALVLRILEPLSADDVIKIEDFARAQGVDIWLQPKGPESAMPMHPEAVDRLKLVLDEFDVRISFKPTDFTQVNHRLNVEMVSRAVKLLELDESMKVADFFCGLGNSAQYSHTPNRSQNESGSDQPSRIEVKEGHGDNSGDEDRILQRISQ